MKPWLWCLCLVVHAGLAVDRGQNLLREPGFEQDAGWRAYGQGGFTYDEQERHSGRRSLRVSSDQLTGTCGVMQVVTFDPPVQHPLRISGWSRAAGADVQQDYDLYLDVHYADGTPLWGQKASFRPGTHDWERAEQIFTPAKPVQSIEVFVLFRQAKGTVWFDDLELCLAPFEWQTVRLLPGLFGRDSAAVLASTTMPAKWTADLVGSGWQGQPQTGPAQPVRVSWRWPRFVRPAHVKLTATDELRGETITRELPLPPLTDAPARPYAVWTADSMTRVLPSSLPATVAAAPEARLALAGNEAESCQVVVLPPPGQPLRDVTVELSDLVGDHGRIPRAQLEWQQVGYVQVAHLRPHPADPEAVAGWWPDPLLPVERFSVPENWAQPIWVTVNAPPATPAGEYRGTVTMRPAGQPPCTVGLVVQVYPFDLPTRGHLKTAFALMDGFLERIYGRPLTAGLRQRYGDYLLRRRLNPDDISRTEAPDLADLQHYADRGLNAFNVLNMVEPRGRRAWVCYSETKTYTPAFKQALLGRLDAPMAAIRQAGLTDRAYVYTFDERPHEFWPIMREYFGLIHERYPGVKTMTTASVPQDPAVMKDLQIDWNCPLTPSYNYEQAERCRAAGLQVWAYVCMGPGYPYANWLATHPLAETRVFGWQAFQQKMDGVLYWGLNIWDGAHNHRAIDPAKGPCLDWSITTGRPGGEWDWLHGDGRLIYPGPDGPLGSIRLENLRDGLDDYEYLWLLSRKLSVDAARTACEPVTTSLTTYTRDPVAIRKTRGAIAAQLGSLAAAYRRPGDAARMAERRSGGPH